MTKKIITVAIIMLAMLLFVGAASAADVVVKPDSGTNVDGSGTIIVPIGSDAAVSVGLGVDYSGFVAGNPYTQDITDPSLVVVTGTASSGGLPTGNDFIPIHWTPSLSDAGKIFTVNAEATTSSGARIKHIMVSAPAVPTPELSTGILSAAGLLGLVGLVYRKKNN